MNDTDFSTLNLPYKKKEWVDADQRMFDACFVILGQYVEEELGKTLEKDNSYNGYNLFSTNEDEKTAIDLWIWYSEELPRIIKDVDEDTLKWADDKNHKSKYDYDYIENLQTIKLNELMSIRKSLWV